MKTFRILLKRPKIAGLTLHVLPLHISSAATEQVLYLEQSADAAIMRILQMPETAGVLIVQNPDTISASVVRNLGSGTAQNGYISTGVVSEIISDGALAAAN